MKLGFITNAFAWAGLNDLEQIAQWGSKNGFTDLEIGPSIPLEEVVFDRIAVAYGIKPSAFIYCRNFLDPAEGEEHRENLEKRIRFAGKIGADKVICSTGITDKAVVDNHVLRYDPESCVAEIAEFLKPVAELAEKHNVQIALELCPMMFNTAISPYMLHKIFDVVDSKQLGFTYDPSHLVWEMIDPYTLIQEFSSRLFHVHGKDAEILWDRLKRVGILHTTHRFPYPVDNGEGIKEYDNMWYRYRLPGFGALDWKRIISELQLIGYNGSVSIEHEDPVWCGSLEKIKKGMQKSRDHLNLYL